MSKTALSTLSGHLLAWWDLHGRKDLPWQQQPTPYRVWVSEIMLQQTQVTTVIPYYQRFMKRFPDVQTLAAAEEDAVLHHWSGLGYYARARNLRRTAQLICDRYGGEFPLNLAEVIQLPGIGRSTAGAILSLSANQRHAIMDGNVKRVLTRYHAIEGWPGHRDIETQLWELAERHIPSRRVAHYTQAIMDLGATLCTRSKPGCASCPLGGDCQGLAQNRATAFPTPKPRGPLPVRSTHMLMVRDTGASVLLFKRPPAGIWGGLWSLPECSDGDVIAWCRQRLGCGVREEERWPPLRHTFSHFHLDIHPVLLRMDKDATTIMDDHQAVWYNPCAPLDLGVAAPVQRLLTQLITTRR